jgi:hypothetical protein
MRRVREIVIDDYTGDEVDALTTETFTVNGDAYEIDLGPDSQRHYAAAIDAFRICARKVGRATGTGTTLQPVRLHPGTVRSVTRRPRVDREQSRAIREWWARYAEAAGLPTPKSPRGSIPKKVSEAFHRYGGGPVPAAGRRRAGKATATG